MEKLTINHLNSWAYNVGLIFHKPRYYAYHVVKLDDIKHLNSYDYEVESFARCETIKECYDFYRGWREAKLHFDI